MTARPDMGRAHWGRRPKPFTSSTIPTYRRLSAILPSSSPAANGGPLNCNRHSRPIAAPIGQLATPLRKAGPPPALLLASTLLQLYPAARLRPSIASLTAAAMRLRSGNTWSSRTGL